MILVRVGPSLEPGDNQHRVIASTPDEAASAGFDAAHGEGSYSDRSIAFVTETAETRFYQATATDLSAAMGAIEVDS